jgi:hypothetical protein
VVQGDGWSHGRIGDMFGDFPSDCVKLHPHCRVVDIVRASFDYAVSSSLVSLSPSLPLRALHRLNCVCPALMVSLTWLQEDDATELSFHAGDSLEILTNNNPGWWLASHGGRIGTEM